MALPIYVYTEDDYLFLKIQALCDKEGLILYRIGKEEHAYPVCIWDTDRRGTAQRVLPTMAHERLLTVSREQSEGVTRLPIANRELLSFLRGEPAGESLTLSETTRSAHIYGEQIKLTELEYTLLSYLMARGGECATNEELVAHLWDGQASAGAVNVYIHYLREKLELRGERIILVRRGKGYYIEPKFLKGEGVC